MKSTLFTLGALAAAVTAQDIASLPQCGQTCANNMMAAAKAQELKCQSGDMKCLCSNVNFVYGLRDCSKAICDADGASKVLNYAVTICKNAGVTINPGDGSNGNGNNGNGNQSGAASSGAANSGAANSGASNSGAANSGAASSGAASSGASNSGAANSGAAQVTTIYSTSTDKDGKVITTAIATSTISGANGDNGAHTDANGNPITTMATMTSGNGGEATGTNSGSNGNGNGSNTSSGSNGGNGGQSSSTSSGLGAQMTAAPAGILAAAGIAALFL